VAWFYGDLPVITDQRSFWSCAECAVLWAPLTERQIREIVWRAEIPPAGRRPHGGRGRAPLVFEADLLIDLLSRP
jgi:hypothetical protein